MSRIFWDTNLYIYLFENYAAFSQMTVALRTRMLQRGDQLFTSTLSLGEILVKPLEAKNLALADKYELAIKTTSVLLPLDANAAKIYAGLRSDRSLRAPDAIQLACAANARVDLFITNDARLQSKHVDGVQFIVPLDRVPI